MCFTDFDGVLNSANYIKSIGNKFDDPKYQIDPEAVIRLNSITDATGALIVVSSTWRLAFDHLDDLITCLSSYGITGKIIGMTPHKPNSTRNTRGKEIQAWLDNRRLHENDIDSFVILDDDPGVGKLKSYLVRTYFADGLQDHHVNTVINILGKK